MLLTSWILDSIEPKLLMYSSFVSVINPICFNAAILAVKAVSSIPCCKIFCASLLSVAASVALLPSLL